MPDKLEHLDVVLEHKLPAKLFAHVNRLDVLCAAVVQVADGVDQCGDARGIRHATKGNHEERVRP